MRIEVIPLILGGLLVLVGLLLAADAILPDGTIVAHERRRRTRTERNRPGELAIAIGLLAMAAALIGRDTWRYSTVVAIIGVVALAVGSFLNLNFLRDYLFNRGVSRRGAPASVVTPKSAPVVGGKASAAKPATAAAKPASSASGKPGPGDRSPNQPSGKPGPGDRSPNQPSGKPKMRDNRKHPRG